MKLTKYEKYALWLVQHSAHNESADRRVQAAMDKLLQRRILIEASDDGVELEESLEMFIVPGDGLPASARKDFDVVVVDRLIYSVDCFCIDDTEPDEDAQIEVWVDKAWQLAEHPKCNGLYGTAWVKKWAIAQQVAFLHWRHADHEKHYQETTNALFPMDAVRTSIAENKALRHAIGDGESAERRHQRLIRLISDCGAVQPFLLFDRMFLALKGEYQIIEKFAEHCKLHGFEIESSYFAIERQSAYLSIERIKDIGFRKYAQHAARKKRYERWMMSNIVQTFNKWP